MIRVLTIDEVNDNWEKVRPLIDIALLHEFYDADDVKDFCEKNIVRMYVIGDYQAICTAELIRHPKKKTLLVHTLGGHGMNEWLDELLERLEYDAISQGATSLQVNGRRGWIKSAGFNEVYTTMVKEL